MQYRVFGKTGWQISEISFGSWAIGGSWGKVDDQESLDALREALDLGVNFIDTADNYGNGRSERLIGSFIGNNDEIKVATKLGRRLSPHIAEGYTEDNIRSFIESSLRNLQRDCLDLIQLHTPPTKVYYKPEVFEILDSLVKEGKIRYYGVSVETVEEGLKAIEYPNVASVQIIFNMFRHRPAEKLLAECKARNVAVIARVPLASGLLTGKITADTEFPEDDHRNFNRYGEKFDRGETFSGVDFHKGLKAVSELKELVPSGFSLAQLALKWILMHPEISCTIPGAKKTSQVQENVSSINMPGLSSEVMEKVADIYNKYIKEDVHHRW